VIKSMDHIKLYVAGLYSRSCVVLMTVITVPRRSSS